MYEKDFAALQNLPAWTLLQSHSPPIRDREKKMGDRSTRVFGIAPALIIEQWYPSLGGSRIPVPQPCLESSTTPISLIAFDASSTPVLRPSFRKTAAPLRKQSCHELSSRRRTRLRRTYSWTADRTLSLCFRSTTRTVLIAMSSTWSPLDFEFDGCRTRLSSTDHGTFDYK